jgi:hypothetical protein
LKLPTKLGWRVFLTLAWCLSACADGVHHYVFFAQERDRLTEPSFIGLKALEGAQVKYTWRELEPQQDAYDFSPIRHDLEVLKANGKRLFVQVQDSTFDAKYINVPKYLLNDPRYHGGADKQFDFEGDDESHATPAGWVARRWDPEVSGRFHKLLLALGREFDGQVEGVNLAETAVSFGESGRWFPQGFTPAIYRDAVLSNMVVFKQAFPKSVVMVYANFMPGEWLPDNDHSYLRSVYQRAKELKVGVAGPDLLPYKPGQMHHSYPLIRECAGLVPTAIAVQEGNYQFKNPKTGRQVSIAELAGFATEYLEVKYIFWCTQEPFYSDKLLPWLAGQ